MPEFVELAAYEALKNRCEELEEAIVWLCTEMPVGWEEVIAGSAGPYIVDVVKSAHPDGDA